MTKRPERKIKCKELWDEPMIKQLLKKPQPSSRQLYLIPQAVSSAEKALLSKGVGLCAKKVSRDTWNESDFYSCKQRPPQAYFTPHTHTHSSKHTCTDERSVINKTFRKARRNAKREIFSGAALHLRLSTRLVRDMPNWECKWGREKWPKKVSASAERVFGREVFPISAIKRCLVTSLWEVEESILHDPR